MKSVWFSHPHTPPHHQDSPWVPSTLRCARPPALSLTGLIVNRLLNPSAASPGTLLVAAVKSMPRGAEAWSVSPSLTLYHLHKCHKRRKGKSCLRIIMKIMLTSADILVSLGNTHRSMSNSENCCSFSKQTQQNVRLQCSEAKSPLG